MRIIAGNPTTEELAAVLVALHATGDPGASPHPSHDPSRLANRPGPTRPAETPAWSRAARREAMGSPPIASPSDLHRLE